MLSAFIVVFGLLTFTMLLAEVVHARTIRRPSPPSWRATACVRAGHSALIEHERARGVRARGVSAPTPKPALRRPLRV